MVVQISELQSSLSTKPQESELFNRHRGPVTCVAGIPGSHIAVSSGYDSALGLVDFERGSIELLGYHRHLVNRVVVNASGTLAASCSSDYTICLWDLQTRRPVRVLQGHWDDVEDFAFVDDHSGISVSRDRRIFIWNLATGAVIRVLERHERDVLSVEYAGGRIYTSGDDMTLRQWDFASGELLQTWGPFDVETDTCAIDPLLNRVVLGADDGSIRIFDCDSGAAIGAIAAHHSGIKKVAVSTANGDILSAAYDQRLLIWDATSLQLKQQLEPHTGTWERSLNWTPDGRHVLAGTFDGTVLRWDVSTGRRLDEIPQSSGERGNACFNDVAGRATGLCAAVSDDGHVRLANLSPSGSSWLDQVTPQSRRILMNAVHLSEPLPKESAGAVVWAGTHDQVLRVFEINNGQFRRESELMLGQGPINCIRVQAAGANAQEAFVACYSGAVVQVRREPGVGLSVTKCLEIHQGAVKALRLHPHEPLGISGAADGSLYSWDLNGAILRRFAGHTAIVDDVDFSPSGRCLASVSRDFTVNVYDASSGIMLHSILLGRQSPKCVLFWDDNTVLVGNYWGAIWRVELASETVTPVQVAGNGISSLSRCGDGTLVAASYDGSVYLLEVDGMTVCSRLQSMEQKLAGFEFKASFDY